MSHVIFQPIFQDCTVWDDGCNTCTCNKDGTVGECTDRMCVMKGEPRCIEELIKCPEIMCALACDAGYVRDESGCDTCVCVPTCPKVERAVKFLILGVAIVSCHFPTHLPGLRGVG